MEAMIYSSNGAMVYQVEMTEKDGLIPGLYKVVVKQGKPNKMTFFRNGEWRKVLNRHNKLVINKAKAELK